MAAYGYGQNVGRLTYIFYQHSSSPVYDIARIVMKPTYEGKVGHSNPLIGIAEVDLNGDNQLEIISKPTEEYEEEGEFCRANYICPHYITQIDGNKTKSLGVIYGNIVDLGTDVKNGYWQLVTLPDPSKPEIFETYEYNPQQAKYVLVKQ